MCEFSRAIITYPYSLAFTSAAMSIDGTEHASRGHERQTQQIRWRHYRLFLLFEAWRLGVASEVAAGKLHCGWHRLHTRLHLYVPFLDERKHTITSFNCCGGLGGEIMPYRTVYCSHQRVWQSIHVHCNSPLERSIETVDAVDVLRVSLDGVRPMISYCLSHARLLSPILTP